MKNIFFLGALLIGIYSFSQPVILRAAPANTVKDFRWMGGLNAFMPAFDDTLSASASKGIDSSGALVYIRETKSMWYRQHSPKKWMEVGGTISTPTLQQVLGAGNSATGVALSIANATINTGWLRVNSLVTLGGSYASILNTNGTQANNLTLPDSSGTVPLRIKSGSTYIAADTKGTLDIGSITATPTLQQVTDAGTVTTTSITANGLRLTGGTAFQGRFEAGTITSSHIWTLPNYSGTVATIAADSTSSPINMIYQGVDGQFHKAAAPSSGLSGTGLVSASGTTISYNTTSASIASIISDETGTGSMVFGTTPTFTTSIITPAINGGTAANDDVRIQGTTNATRTTSYLTLQENGGNVGVGIASPASTLDVVGDYRIGTGVFSPRARMFIQDASAADANNTSLKVYPISGGNNAQSIGLIPSGTGYSSTYKTAFGMWNTDYIADPTNYDLFVTVGTGSSYVIMTQKGGSQTVKPIVLDAGVNVTDHTNATAAKQLYLKTNGFVGINTLTPDFYLDIWNTSNPLLRLYNSATPGAFSGAFQYYNSPTPTAADQRLGGLVFGAKTSNSSTNGALIAAYSSQAYTVSSAEGTYLAFWTTPTGTASIAEKWRISDAGNLTNLGANGSAYFHLKAGTATANTAPIKLTTGTLNTTAVAGQVEYNNSFYETKASALRYGLGGVIADFTSDVSNSGTSETDIYTYTTPASTLAATGEKLTAQYTLNLTDITATAQVQTYFAGTVIGNTGALTVSATGSVVVNVTVIRTGASTARATVYISSPTASTSVYTSETDLTGLTFTNTNIIKVTATAGGGTGGSGDIVGKLGFVNWLAAAAN